MASPSSVGGFGSTTLVRVMELVVLLDMILPDADGVPFLREIAGMNMIAHVAPIQLAIRLLIPEGSLLLELPDVRAMIEIVKALG